MNKTMKVILLGTALTAAMISAGCGDSSTSKSSAASRANLCRRSNREES